MKYYPQNSPTVEYIEKPNNPEADNYTLIIQTKDYRNLVSLHSVLHIAKKEDIPTMNITVIRDNLQIHLQLTENSNYLTVFRFMSEFRFITNEFYGMIYKSQIERLTVQHNQSKSPFTKSYNTFQNAQQEKDTNIRQHALNKINS